MRHFPTICFLSQGGCGLVRKATTSCLHGLYFFGQVPSENHNLWVCGVTFDEGHSSPPVTKKKSQPPSTSANAISVKGGPPKAVIKSKFVGSSADPCLPMQHGACVTLEVCVRFNDASLRPYCATNSASRFYRVPRNYSLRLGSTCSSLR